MKRTEELTKAIEILKQVTPISQEAYEMKEIIASEMNLDEETQIATLIYKSLPKKNIKIEEITELLGNEIATLIENLLKIADIPQKRYKNHLENYIKLLLTLSGDVRVIFIILAEQVWNIRNIENFPMDDQEAIAKKIELLYAKIAHRLGFYKIKTEMDELMMKHFNYDVYISIAKKLDAKVKEREAYISNFISPIKKQLDKQGYTFTIKGRPKSISSIWKKMQRQGAKFEEVYDLFAIRIIIDIEEEKENDACWEVFSQITEQYKSHPKRLRDWLSNPKDNGYKSLHATVLGPEEKWIEVQIRSKLMDEIAESGLAAHWKYKAYAKKSQNNEDIFGKIKNALEHSSEDKEDKEKKKLYSDEIFIFTPNGDLKKISNGSTVLDFAFLIHSKIGGKCIGARVNNKYCSYKQILNNGDTVKIVVSQKQKPKLEWLKVAQNQRTKRKIKQLIKLEEYKQALVGKDILKRKFKRLNIKFTDNYLIELENYHDSKNRTELLQKYGDGTYDVKNVKNILFDKEEKEEINNIVDLETLSVPKPNSDNVLYIDKNLEAVEYTRAKCCNPIPGDSIYAFVSVGRGAIIHRKNCPNTENILLKYPYRVLNAKWKDNIIDFSSPITIMILGKDRIGIASSITDIISNESQIKMKSLNIKEAENDNFVAYISVIINNKKQLNSLISRLLKIEDVFKVTRMK